MRSLEDIDIEIMEVVHEKNEVLKHFDDKLKRLRQEKRYAVTRTLNEKVTRFGCVCYYEKGKLVTSGRCAVHGLLAVRLQDKDVIYEPNRNK